MDSSSDPATRTEPEAAAAGDVDATAAGAAAGTVTAVGVVAGAEETEPTGVAGDAWFVVAAFVAAFVGLGGGTAAAAATGLGFCVIMTIKLASVTPAPSNVVSSVNTFPLCTKTNVSTGAFCDADSCVFTAPTVSVASSSRSNLAFVLYAREEGGREGDKEGDKE